MLEWTFSASGIFQTIFDCWKGIEQVLYILLFFQSIYRLKCWYLSEWQLVLSWQFFSWLWSFYIVSKRKPVVVDWILQANTNRQILKGKVFLKGQKRVTCLCRVSQVMWHFKKLFFVDWILQANINLQTLKAIQAYCCNSRNVVEAGAMHFFLLIWGTLLQMKK